MGLFSWITQDTRKSIPVETDTKKSFEVYMHDNKGNKWKEAHYGGYGDFGQKDYYILLAEMNGMNKPSREDGLELAFLNSNILYPNLTENENWVWKNHEPQKCPYQGYFYNDEVIEEFKHFE